MAIVASNNITVSNVNDGTITHTAYAYSADGTDRFTTVYPNLNLLNFNSGVTLGKYYGWAANITSWSGNRAYFKKVKVTPNSQYTISADWSNTAWLNIYAFTNESDTTAVARYGSKSGLGTYSWDTNFIDISIVSNNTTFTVPANVNYIGVSYASLSTNTLTLQALLNGKPKLELGSIATPWMPSSSEVKTSDYPSYIGQYRDFTQADSTNPSDYIWSLIRGSDGSDGVDGVDGISPTVTVNPDTSLTIVDAQGTSTTPALKGADGTDGADGTSGIIVSSVAPDSPQAGQLWQDTSTTPQLVKKWTGNAWVIWELYAQNLKADTLETISATIGKISNTFDNSSGGIDNKGTITIEDSIKVDYYNGNSRTTIDLVTSSSGQGLFTQHLPDKTDTSKFKQSWYMPTGLYFTDSINNWTGQITAENVTLVPWTNLTYSAGYTTANDNPCQYRKIKNLDGSYTVQFRGQVKPVSGSFPGTNSESNFQIIANIPVNIRPSINTLLPAVGDMMGTQTIRIGALSDGRIQVGVRGTASSYIVINSLVYTI